MQSVFFYQVNFLSYLKISILVKALLNGLALLLDFPVTSQISIHVLSVGCLNYPLVFCDIINLFIDSYKESLNGVLLHNGNVFGSIYLGHSTTLKTKYSEIKFVLKKISYYEHN